MTTDKDFFYINNITNTSKEDISDIFHDDLQPIAAFSRCIAGNVYVINYEKKGYDYISDNQLFLCGYTAEEIVAMGSAFYRQRIPKEDLELFIKTNKIGVDFLEKLPIDDRKKYTVSCDFHIRNQFDKLVLVNHKLTPMLLTKSGKIWKALCIVTLSSAKKPGNIRLINSHGGKSLAFDPTQNRWLSEISVTLSEREKEIIQLSVRGFAIQEIAAKIHVSVETVKLCRRKIFEKLNADSINEVISMTRHNSIF